MAKQIDVGVDLADTQHAEAVAAMKAAELALRGAIDALPEDKTLKRMRELVRVTKKQATRAQQIDFLRRVHAASKARDLWVTRGEQDYLCMDMVRVVRSAGWRRRLHSVRVGRIHLGVFVASEGASPLWVPVDEFRIGRCAIEGVGYSRAPAALKGGGA